MFLSVRGSKNRVNSHDAINGLPNNVQQKSYSAASSIHRHKHPLSLQQSEKNVTNKRVLFFWTRAGPLDTKSMSLPVTEQAWKQPQLRHSFPYFAWIRHQLKSPRDQHLARAPPVSSRLPTHITRWIASTFHLVVVALKVVMRFLDQISHLWAHWSQDLKTKNYDPTGRRLTL